jgi:hypothetical protein
MDCIGLTNGGNYSVISANPSAPKSGYSVYGGGEGEFNSALNTTPHLHPVLLWLCSFNSSYTVKQVARQAEYLNTDQIHSAQVPDLASQIIDTLFPE